LFISSRQISLDALGELTTGKHDTMPTSLALKADIGTKAHDSPLIRATGMRFAQTQQIIELEIGEHLE
jgi:hypothetical protein